MSYNGQTGTTILPKFIFVSTSAGAPLEVVQNVCKPHICQMTVTKWYTCLPRTGRATKAETRVPFTDRKQPQRDRYFFALHAPHQTTNSNATNFFSIEILCDSLITTIARGSVSWKLIYIDDAHIGCLCLSFGQTFTQSCWRNYD